jgi:hypothetical protein
MPEVNQYSFNYKEVGAALVKQAGLHEGKWQVVMVYGLGAANVGANPEQAVPACVVGITSIGLQRATADSPSSLVVDAAELNPAST